MPAGVDFVLDVSEALNEIRKTAPTTIGLKRPAPNHVTEPEEDLTEGAAVLGVRAEPWEDELNHNSFQRPVRRQVHEVSENMLISDAAIEILMDASHRHVEEMLEEKRTTVTPRDMLATYTCVGNGSHD